MAALLRSSLLWERLAVGTATVVALALGLDGIDQSLLGDELFTFAVVGDGPGGILDGIEAYEKSPPLYFALAWLAAQLGDPTELIRLPSVILGVATVPLVYLLGLRTAGRAAAVLGAAITALSPFATFYLTEGRAYRTAMFLVVLSTLLLLKSLDDGRARWWAPFCVAAAGAIYAHYTAVFPLAAQALWALWRRPERRRALALAHCAIAVSYLPWVPMLLEQRDDPTLGSELGIVYLGRTFVSPFFAHPFARLDELQGTIGLAVLAAAVGTAALGAAARLGGRGPGWWQPPPGIALLLLIALATPLGLVAYSLAGENIVFARNLTVALPAMFLLLAAVVVSAPRAIAIPASVAIVAVLAAGSIALTQPEWERSGYRPAAEYVDTHAPAGDPVVSVPSLFLFSATTPESVPFLKLQQEDPLAREASIYVDDSYEQFGVAEVRPGPHAPQVVADPAAWEVAARTGRVHVIAPGRPERFLLRPRLELPRPPGQGPRFRIAERRTFPGLIPVELVSYAVIDPGR